MHCLTIFALQHAEFHARNFLLYAAFPVILLFAAELHWLASAFVHGNASPRLVEQLANVVVAKIADGEPFQWSQLTSFAKVLRAATHPAAADVQAAIDALNNKHTGADGSHQDSEAAGGQQQHQQQQQPSAVHHLWSMHGNSFVAVA